MSYGVAHPNPHPYPDPHPIPHLTTPFICTSTLTLDIKTITDVFQLVLSTLILTSCKSSD